MHNCYSNRAYMHGYCSMCIWYYINFRSHVFFSLFSAQQRTQFSSSFSFSSNAHKQTHPHPHTNTPTHKQTHMDKPTERQIGARGSWPVLDRSSWVLIGAWMELVLIGACGTIGARGSFSWTELDRDRSCLIGAREIWTRGRVDLCWYRDGQKDGTCWRSLLVWRLGLV